MNAFTFALTTLMLFASSSDMPAPSVSDYVKTELGGFTVERGEGIRYAMTYTLLPPSSSATSYKVVFDNTKPKGSPLTVEGTVTPGNPELLVKSPVIPGVKNDRTYSVHLTLFVDGVQLTAHQDSVKFSVPSNLLKQMGIKEY